MTAGSAGSARPWPPRERRPPAALHHAQRQMTFWSDDRNHVLDDLIGALWFGVIALSIGVPPMQFPLLVLVLRFLESLGRPFLHKPFTLAELRIVLAGVGAAARTT